MKKKILLMILLFIITPVKMTKAGGEVLYDSNEGTLYRCGPVYEDICWADDQDGATKVWFGE